MFNFEKTGSAGVLTFFGDLTVHRLSELKSALMLAVENADTLFLNLERVRVIDAACLRVLRGAREKAVALGKRLTLLGEAKQPGLKPRKEYLSLKPV